MHRPYSPERFLEICRKMREARPDLAITTDIIVGFPGESEADYEATKEIVRAVHFDNAFIFRYSPRRGTPAADLPDEMQLPESIKEARNHDLLDLINAQAKEKLAAEVGSIREVLCEGYSKTTETRLTGRSPQNKIVVFEGPHDRLRGELLPIRIIETKGFTLYGELA
jgi:tRNA-2-methylthio-N6-dimethylallyladenosine synthase